MIDLFKDIPEEVITKILVNIKENLKHISLYEGHVISKHVDIQTMELYTRLTIEDIRFATSFYDVELAKKTALCLLKNYYDIKIKTWLQSSLDDVLVLQSQFLCELGYGYKKNEFKLIEGLTKVRMLLEKSEERDWGFRILTYFPIF